MQPVVARRWLEQHRMLSLTATRRPRSDERELPAAASNAAEGEGARGSDDACAEAPRSSQLAKNLHSKNLVRLEGRT